MLAERGTYEIAVLAMVCGTVILFLIFPMPQGPYSVVNGPATTLVSVRARRLLWVGMVPVTVRSLMRQFTQGLTAQPTTLYEILLSQSVLPEQIVTLRC